VFEASYTNTFEEPNSFKELLWNIAGPSVGSMIIFLDLLKDDLEAEEVGLPAKFNKIPANLLALLVEEAGKEHGEQIEYIELILEALDKISQTNSHDEAPSPDEGTNEEASKTQGMLPGAHKASPTEEAAVKPATQAGRDKEGAQSSSMASTGQQKTTLHGSCSQWRGNVINFSKQHHQRSQTMGRCKTSNHLQRGPSNTQVHSTIRAAIRAINVRGKSRSASRTQ
jgi:hypothetical protein